jgi:hypothetical protein
MSRLRSPPIATPNGTPSASTGRAPAAAVAAYGAGKSLRGHRLWDSCTFGGVGVPHPRLFAQSEVTPGDPASSGLW